MRLATDMSPRHIHIAPSRARGPMAKPKKLIETDELIRNAKLKRFGAGGVAKVMMNLLRINKLNKLYEELSDRQGVAFIDGLIEKLELDYEVREDELKRIPTSGPFITVSNHPFGGIDGLLLVKVISEVRTDVKIMANFMMQRIDPVSEFILPVNPFEKRKDRASSLAGIKMAIQHVTRRRYTRTLSLRGGVKLQPGQFREDRQAVAASGHQDDQKCRGAGCAGLL